MDDDAAHDRLVTELEGAQAVFQHAVSAQLDGAVGLGGGAAYRTNVARVRAIARALAELRDIALTGRRDAHRQRDDPDAAAAADREYGPDEIKMMDRHVAETQERRARGEPD